MAEGVFAQHAWNLVLFGVFATVVAVTLNWRNSRMGYWLNLGVVSAADVGFIAAILLPGYIALGDGLPGPVLWILATVFSTIGLRADRPEAAPSALAVGRA